MEPAEFLADEAELPKGGSAHWVKASDSTRLRVALWPAEGAKGTGQIDNRIRGVLQGCRITFSTIFNFLVKLCYGLVDNVHYRLQALVLDFGTGRKRQAGKQTKRKQQF